MLGDGDNSNYKPFEFASNELSVITYLQLPFYEWQPYWPVMSQGLVSVASGV